ncbi:hypothetical protein DE146DRAFT_67929 [Phaeosphaeria sp. MPI-PUGE-AT-0046c]|nr:hypothetical protein DE146DRAFT_67929 [Phaeosphaeria sp. MPI-PUGE-AT-0046c]
MIAKVILPVFLLVLNVSAFQITTYTSKMCTGASAKVTLNVADGCNTFRAGETQAIIMPWLSDMDNDQLLVTYSGETCCHADMTATYGWEDGCTPFVVQGVKSWRVIDPNDPDKGKESEADNYACKNCGKDGCGTINPGLIPVLSHNG